MTEPPMGPVLIFRGITAGEWRLTALMATDTEIPPPPLTAAAGPVAAELLVARPAGTLWRYDFGLPLGTAAGGYAIGDRHWTVALPLGDGLRLAFTACNGDEAEPAPGSARQGRWQHLLAAQRERPAHLLLQGGDQIYADVMWERVPALAAWRKLPRAERLRAPCPADLAAALDDFYFSTYRRVWSQPAIAPVLARLPSLMMWDDHDIFDGWGSYDAALQDCPVYRAIFAAARRAFACFQLGAPADSLPGGFADRAGGHFGWCYSVGPTTVLAPDLRSGRRRDRVMSPAGLAALQAQLDALPRCRDLVLLSSVPLIHCDLSPVERLLELWPGDFPFRDDLRDQWRSHAHRAEWLDLVARLVAFGRRTGSRITVLSGEIHLGAFGRILAEGGGATLCIHQLIAAGVVHPPPPRALTMALDRASRGPSGVAPGLEVEMLPIPGLGRRYLASTCWLEVDLAAAGGLAATWHASDAAMSARWDGAYAT